MAKMLFQLKITLQGIEPPIWRRILIPSTYDFWQLHCAIQDAFGWTDSHLHQFTYTDGLGQSPIEIGIPMDDDFDDENTPLAGWEEKIVDLLIPGDSGILYYLYDFGDSWQHTVELEEVLPYEKGIKYPKCIAGERNGPIEDCGGVPGYAGLVEILLDPTNPEYKDTAEWADSMKGCTFCPETFNPSKVKFSNPGPRLKRLLENI